MAAKRRRGRLSKAERNAIALGLSLRATTPERSIKALVRELRRIQKTTGSAVPALESVLLVYSAGFQTGAIQGERAVLQALKETAREYARSKALLAAYRRRGRLSARLAESSKQKGARRVRP